MVSVRVWATKTGESFADAGSQPSMRGCLLRYYIQIRRQFRFLELADGRTVQTVHWAGAFGVPSENPGLFAALWWRRVTLPISGALFEFHF